jgi:hypothetical protein
MFSDTSTNIFVQWHSWYLDEGNVMEKELSSLLSSWNTSKWGPYLWGNSIAESPLRKFYSFRAFKDILQCNTTREIWQRLFGSVQFILLHHLFIRLRILFFVKFSWLTRAVLHKRPYQNSAYSYVKYMTLSCCMSTLSWARMC